MAKEQRLSQSAEPSVPPTEIVVPPANPPVAKKRTMMELSDEKEQRERE
jgi:hypothetical protein